MVGKITWKTSKAVSSESLANGCAGEIQLRDKIHNDNAFYFDGGAMITYASGKDQWRVTYGNASGTFIRVKCEDALEAQYQTSDHQ